VRRRRLRHPTRKLGGFPGVFLFPFLMESSGLPGAERVAAGVSLLGAVLTFFLLPETKGRNLEQLSEEGMLPAGLPTEPPPSCPAVR
jgi:putative MFS transporter